MQTLVLTIHIIACIFLIAVVLLQSGKEGMGVIFGGGSQSMFGTSGAGSLLAKVTAAFAIIFILTSLGYNKLTGNKVVDDDSIMFEGPIPTAPAEKKADAKPPVVFEEKQDNKTEQ